MRLRAFLALTAILGLILVACGGDDDDSSGDDSGGNTPGTAANANGGSSGKATDACSLLTPDQIKAQFGVTVAAGEGRGAQCSWKPVDFSAQFGGVTLAHEPYDKTFFDGTRNNSKEKVDISGVGDAAFFVAPKNPYTLWFTAGDRLYSLYVVAAGGTPAENQQKVVALAKLVLAK